MTQKISKWTDELIARLKELYLDKMLPTAEIANQLGFTKNAVIGKIHRLNLSRSNIQKDDDNILENKEDPDFIYGFTDPFFCNLDKKKQGEYNLEEVEQGMCIWPYGDRETGFLFCGEKAFADKSYCTHHYDSVYLVIKKASHNKDNFYTTSDIEADEAAIDEDEE